MNFDLVLQRIRELNVIAGEGESVVRSTASGAQLATKESVRLSLYRDGIVLFDGPFRSYREHGAQVSSTQEKARRSSPLLQTFTLLICSSSYRT